MRRRARGGARPTAAARRAAEVVGVHAAEVRDAEALRRLLGRLDGRVYPAYRELAGTWALGDLTLHVDRVAPDPFAPPSRLRVTVPARRLDLPAWVLATRARRVAAADWWLRRLGAALARRSRARGSGHSGRFAVDRPGQEVLERTACAVGPEGLALRLGAGLPAHGRRIAGREALAMLLEDLPRALDEALALTSADRRSLEEHVACVEDQQALRAQLGERGLVAFVGDGALLARESGVSDRPLRGPRAVPFVSPPTLRVELEAPHAGRVAGMGVPAGVTLIVGGGFHGKTTLLRALERGVYDHVPGDGRERVVTDATAVKIRAEDGRRVACVDISAFIADLPGGADTRCFTTENASGSTSQAANIAEALELGARVLLMDEDTSATNFLIRDRRMQALVAKEREPITPLVDRVRELHRRLGVSTVLVLGGSGDYLDVADTVILMDAYVPRDVTAEARAVAARLPTGRIAEAGAPLERPPARAPLPLEGAARERVRARGTDELELGGQEVDLHRVEQIVDPAQLRAIALLADRILRREADGRTPLRELLARAFALVDREGLAALAPPGAPVQDLALPRPLEVGAAINRWPGLRVRPLR